MILLNDIQRQTLRDLSDVREGKNYTQENKPLEIYLQTLRDMYPEKFHYTRSDLEKRVFVDAPNFHAIVPHARAVRPRSKSPYLKDAK
jgi:hypothetical protein